MSSIPINEHPITTGPIMTPSLKNMEDCEVLTTLVGAAMTVAQENIAECYSGVRMLDPLTRGHVLSKYPDAESWRNCASPALWKLVDTIRKFTANIPEAHTNPAAALVGEVFPPEATGELTDEIQLANKCEGSAP